MERINKPFNTSLRDQLQRIFMQKGGTYMPQVTYTERTLKNCLSIQREIFEKFTGQSLPEDLYREVMDKLGNAMNKGPLSNKQGELVIERAVQSYKDRKKSREQAVAMLDLGLGK